DTYQREKHGKNKTIKHRINGCFQRSMNGEPLDENSEEMEAIVSYFDFISKDVEGEDDITWRMTNDKDKVPEPDVNHGEELFEEKNGFLVMRQMVLVEGWQLAHPFGEKILSTKQLG